MKNILVCLFLFISVSSNALEIVGYTLRNDSVSNLTDGDLSRQNKSVKAHIRQVAIIAPQAFQVNKKGTLWGAVDPGLLTLAAKNHVKVMPLVTNAEFDNVATHQFLNDQVAESRAIQEMIIACKTNHFAGIQIDFEHILLGDKKSFTQFYQQVSSALHHNGFLVSVTIIPRTTNKIPTTDIARSCLEYWNGAYDYAALGHASDFVTLMAYDQHGAGTTPGSPSEPAWEESIIVYALQTIPAEKISLGLPVHSSYWYTGFSGKGKRVFESDLSYQEALYLLKEYHASVVWNKKTNVPYAVFSKDHLNQYIFPENAATFKIQLALVRKYKLRGVSLWRLGYEDPRIWRVI